MYHKGVWKHACWWWRGCWCHKHKESHGICPWRQNSNCICKWHRCLGYSHLPCYMWDGHTPTAECTKYHIDSYRTRSSGTWEVLLFAFCSCHMYGLGNWGCHVKVARADPIGGSLWWDKCIWDWVGWGWGATCCQSLCRQIKIILIRWASSSSVYLTKAHAVGAYGTNTSAQCCPWKCRGVLLSVYLLHHWSLVNPLLQGNCYGTLGVAKKNSSAK